MRTRKAVSGADVFFPSQSNVHDVFHCYLFFYVIISLLRFFSSPHHLTSCSGSSLTLRPTPAFTTSAQTWWWVRQSKGRTIIIFSQITFSRCQSPHVEAANCCLQINCGIMLQAYVRVCCGRWRGRGVSYIEERCMLIHQAARSWLWVSVCVCVYEKPG